MFLRFWYTIKYTIMRRFSIIQTQKQEELLLLFVLWRSSCSTILHSSIVSQLICIFELFAFILGGFATDLWYMQDSLVIPCIFSEGASLVEFQNGALTSSTKIIPFNYKWGYNHNIILIVSLWWGDFKSLAGLCGPMFYWILLLSMVLRCENSVTSLFHGLVKWSFSLNTSTLELWLVTLHRFNCSGLNSYSNLPSLT
jgi:hypothetical protein